MQHIYSVKIKCMSNAYIDNKEYALFMHNLYRGRRWRRRHRGGRWVPDATVEEGGRRRQYFDAAGNNRPLDRASRGFSSVLLDVGQRRGGKGEGVMFTNVIVIVPDVII